MKIITREEFRADPGEAIRAAHNGERVGVLNSEGKVSLTISGQEEWPEDAELRKLRERVAELEDTVRLEAATADQHSSYGRNETANAVLDAIAARHGEDWNGAEVDYPGPLKAAQVAK